MCIDGETASIRRESVVEEKKRMISRLSFDADFLLATRWTALATIFHANL
jgi:hypothetical protein